jgi:hypothetical protein
MTVVSAIFSVVPKWPRSPSALNLRWFYDERTHSTYRGVVACPSAASPYAKHTLFGISIRRISINSGQLDRRTEDLFALA